MGHPGSNALSDQPSTSSQKILSIKSRLRFGRNLHSLCKISLHYLQIRKFGIGEEEAFVQMDVRMAERRGDEAIIGVQYILGCGRICTCNVRDDLLNFAVFDVDVMLDFWIPTFEQDPSAADQIDFLTLGIGVLGHLCSQNVSTLYCRECR